jgi:competence protein ComEA
MLKGIVEEYKIQIMSIVIITLASFGYIIMDQGKEDEKIFVKEANMVKPETSQKSDTQKNSDVYIDIKGQVAKPGVYILKSDNRIQDVINLAGGFLSDAETKSVNLAQKLTDEMVIYVPKKGEIESNVVPTSQQGSVEKLNINSADVADFDSLPGIGPSKAKNIIEFRDSQGGFKSIEELKEVNGIGESTFEKLKDLIDIK